MIDPVLASRLQFALTTAVHILFPAISMGLAPFLVYFTWKSIRSDDPIYTRHQRFWTKIFAITFVCGTVTGIVLEFEFGTNFATFSTAVGELFGGPLATEGMMAFFLESTFLGVFVFGRERVSDRLYMLSAVLVALGSWLSAVWILIANSWMQTPRGYEMVEEGGMEVVHLTDPIAAYANPRFVWMFVHMQTAAVISVALLLAGLAAYHVLRDRDPEFWTLALKVGVVALLITAPLQAIQGDAYARHVHETQPQKFAAMEAIYETDSGVVEALVAVPTDLEGFTDPRTTDLFIIGIPGGASFLASGGDPTAEIQGLNEFEGMPPVAYVFWSFRLMIALGFWFIALGLWAGYRWSQGRLTTDRRLLYALVLSAGGGLFATELGWIVTEVGRQPWLFDGPSGSLRTAEGVTTSLTGGEATLTLAGFVLGYSALLVVYVTVVRWMIRNGPPSAADVGMAEEVTSDA
ncbi:cytochrome ubiquinol oxidase subunit I [Halococcoides cellulosivorans]|uniref:Cytochrome ubiquinol oxidase subunit I n=1 Tax=Halococcoides cellulosivorans TaxID=1679096 RepID=A0A2R4X0Y3_9EURY|nr:cytochrome ubiquinol oxidase subunit I [Halococcoides cellulosivorans]AWB27458.1 cytochrome ubiquinol oxidase subunit I [Halococcoides cellulosivorans]